MFLPGPTCSDGACTCLSPNCQKLKVHGVGAATRTRNAGFGILLPGFKCQLHQPLAV